MYICSHYILTVNIKHKAGSLKVDQKTIELVSPLVDHLQEVQDHKHTVIVICQHVHMFTLHSYCQYQTQSWLSQSQRGGEASPLSSGRSPPGSPSPPAHCHCHLSTCTYVDITFLLSISNTKLALSR